MFSITFRKFALLVCLLPASALAVTCPAGPPCSDLNTQLKGSRLPSWGVDSGTANAYAIATMGDVGSGGVIQTGSRFMFIATHANTSASTLAVNGGSAIAIKKNVSSALASGDIALNQVIEVTYDGTNFQLMGNVGSVACSQLPAFTGDTTTSAGSCTTTTGKVNGVSYPTDTSTNTVPVKTSSGAVTYEAVPNAALANSSTTVNGTTCTLGSSCTVSGGGGGGGVNEVGPAQSAPATLASWTKIDPTGTGVFSDLTSGGGYANGVFVQAPASSTTLTGLYIATPGVPFTLTARFQTHFTLQSPASVGLFVGDSGNKLEVFGIQFSSGLKTWVGGWTNSTTVTTDRLAASLFWVLDTAAYYRVIYDGTTLKYQVSSIGMNGTFTQVYSESATVFLASVSKIGFGATAFTVAAPASITLAYWNLTTP